MSRMVTVLLASLLCVSLAPVVSARGGSYNRRSVTDVIAIEGKAVTPVGLAVVVSSIVLAAAAVAQQRFPDDVTRFIEQRDACDHFRGEEPYDAERRKFLAQQMRQFCAGTDAQLARLKQKYGGDTAVTTRLADYESQIEAGPQR